MLMLKVRFCTSARFTMRFTVNNQVLSLDFISHVFYSFPATYRLQPSVKDSLLINRSLR